jgi:predicted dehydrogenase
VNDPCQATRQTLAVPTPLPITGRPIRLAIVGLGTISELVLPTYADRSDVEVVALCDRDPDRVARWARVWPAATTAPELSDLGAVDADVIDVLVPTPAHGDVVTAALERGHHVQVQKPLARNIGQADRMVALASARGAMLRVMEDYLFFPPIAALGRVLASGAIGEPAGIHMKIVATGRGGWDVPLSSYQWQFEQARDGRGMLVFDHGWHQLAVAMSLLGDVRRIFAWIGRTEVVPGIGMDAPSTLVWEHTNGVRGVLDITFAPDTYFRSDYYTGDERIEVTGTQGFARCNRISACGVQEPSVVVYREGEVRAMHALDDTLPAGFAASTEHVITYLRGETSELVLDGVAARRVLRALLTALDSSEAGRPLDVDYS